MKILKYILLFFAVSFQAQTGGEYVFTFLNFPTSARQNALGGATLTLTDETDQPLTNPATISEDLDQMLSLNYVNFLADVNYFSGSYAFTIDRRVGTFHSGISYMNYGKFIAADEEGVETGTFKAYDMALSVGYAYQFPHTDISVGSNVKWIHSVIEEYRSMAVAADVGVFYQPYQKPYSMALVVRNAGMQLTSYDGTKELLPLVIQAGWSYQLEHLPLRVYTTLDNLQKWQLAYANPSDQSVDLSTGETMSKEPSFANNLMRHIVLGAELFPDKGFSLRMGYNFQRAQELKLQEQRTFAGISLGFGLKVKRFKLNYAFSKFHPAANSHNFSLGINLNE